MVFSQWNRNLSKNRNDLIFDRKMCFSSVYFDHTSVLFLEAPYLSALFIQMSRTAEFPFS